MTASRRATVFSFLTALLVVSVMYLGTVRTSLPDWRWGEEQKDYYSLLVHGFLKGRLGLDAAVPLELLQCSDPYDPAQRPPGVALHDAALFRGQYFIYHGVVPAALVLLPFRVLSGFDLPLPVVVLGFALLSYIIATALLFDVRRRFFPRASLLLTGAAAVGYGFASCAPVLLRRCSMYELPIVSGACFALAGIAGLYLAALSDRRRIRWIALSSTAWGLAVGCRPTYVVPALVLFVATAWWMRRRTTQRESASPSAGTAAAWRLAFAATLPIAAIGAALAWYNYARFGNVTEFGVRYILSGVYEAKIEHFRLRYFGWNLRAYLFAPGEWGRYFPFFHERPFSAALPKQHYGIDHPFGLLTHVPLMWLALFAWLNPRAMAVGAPGAALRALRWILAWMSITMALVLFCFYAAMGRYLGDIAPFSGLLGVMGLLAGADVIVDRGGLRRVFISSLMGLITLVSIAEVGCFSAQLYSQWRTSAPASYAVFSRWANLPVYVWERISPPPVGALNLRLRLPSAPRQGRSETLVSTGWGTETDRVGVNYLENGRVEFEYEHRGAPAFRSGPIEMAGGDHTIGVTMGALFQSAVADRDVAKIHDPLRRWLQVTVDSTVVLERSQRFYPASAGALRIGGKGDAVFSGTIWDVARESVQVTQQRVALSPGLSLVKPPVGGSEWILRLRLGAARAGAKEPLVVIGETGKADFLIIEYLADGRVRFALDHWGKAIRFSSPFELVGGREYRLGIAHPGLNSNSLSHGPVSGRLTVRVDDRVVWDEAVVLYPGGDEDVYLGANLIGGSGCAQRFGGRIEFLPN